MTVAELIALLKTVPDDRQVFIWVDGERYPITEVDPIVTEDDPNGWYVDINAGETA